VTAVLEPLVELDGKLTDQARFDATRPPCPPYCEDDQHFGDACMHTGTQTVLPCQPENQNGLPATVSVHPSRYDVLDETPEEEVELYIGDAQSHLGDHVPFTAQQAYDLGVALMATARLLSGELTVAAAEVKIGDLLDVGGRWLHVYSVLTDEPSDKVQISVTADPVDWSDLDSCDDNPQTFNLADPARIRRTTPAGGNR
jgi:hypothetical protein